MGGMVPAIEEGFVKGQIEDRAYEFQRDLEEKRRLIVGVNTQIEEDEAPPTDILTVNPEIEHEQRARLKVLREGRDNTTVKALLAELTKAVGPRRTPSGARCAR